MEVWKVQRGKGQAGGILDPECGRLCLRLSILRTWFAVPTPSTRGRYHPANPAQPVSAAVWAAPRLRGWGGRSSGPLLQLSSLQNLWAVLCRREVVGRTSGAQASRVEKRLRGHLGWGLEGWKKETFLLAVLSVQPRGLVFPEERGWQPNTNHPPIKGTLWG